MGITAFMALLKFTLLCIDFLGWPSIALGYPLFASIRAVESDSKYHMKKLVIYWTLFSLFSLFEFAFAKIIEWIPFWSTVRLVVFFWLVMPWFDGSSHAYQGLVRPILLMKLQAVIDRFHQQNEDRICNRESHENQEWIKSDRETKFLESEGRDAAATAQQLIEHEAVRQEIETVESTEKIATATESHQSTSLDRKDAVTYFNETPPPPKASTDNRSSETPLMKPQQEWTCHLCKVTTKNEITLNSHLQGKEHKSKLESLKASMLSGPSPLVHQKQPTKGTAEERCGETETPPLKKTPEKWSCHLCKVTTTSQITLDSHLLGSKHKANLETLKASKVHIEAEETTPPEWTCDLCTVRTTSWKTLISHFRGSKHRAMLESLKTSGLHTKDTGIVNKDGEGIVKKGEQSEHWCIVCNVKLLRNVDLKSHLKGKKHSSNIEALISCQ